MTKQDDRIAELSVDGLRDVLHAKYLELLPAAIKRLGPSESELIKKGRIVLISEPAVNASTESWDNWQTFDIQVSLGLMRFSHEMTKFFSTRFGVVLRWQG